LPSFPPAILNSASVFENCEDVNWELEVGNEVAGRLGNLAPQAVKLTEEMCHGPEKKLCAFIEQCLNLYEESNYKAEDVAKDTSGRFEWMGKLLATIFYTNEMAIFDTFRSARNHSYHIPLVKAKGAICYLDPKTGLIRNACKEVGCRKRTQEMNAIFERHFSPSILAVTKMISSTFSGVSILARFKKITIFSTRFKIDAHPIAAFDYHQLSQPLSLHA
jgi:hypothetical protein